MSKVVPKEGLRLSMGIMYIHVATPGSLMNFNQGTASALMAGHRVENSIWEPLPKTYIRPCPSRLRQLQVRITATD